jgi:hypothetical protein
MSQTLAQKRALTAQSAPVELSAQERLAAMHKAHAAHKNPHGNTYTTTTDSNKPAYNAGFEHKYEDEMSDGGPILTNIDSTVGHHTGGNTVDTHETAQQILHRHQMEHDEKQKKLGHTHPAL